MAIFSKSLGAGSNLQSRGLSRLPAWVSATGAMLQESATIASSLDVVDLKAQEELLKTAALDIKSTFPEWHTALETARTDLKAIVEKQGPMGDDVKNTYRELSTEITQSKALALRLKTLQTETTDQYNQLNSRLATQQQQSTLSVLVRGLAATLTFSALSGTLKGPDEKKRQEALKTFSTLKSQAEAQTQEQALTAVKTALQALLDSSSDTHLLVLQAGAEAEERDEALKAQETRAEWQTLQRDFWINYRAAQDAGASEAVLASVTRIFERVRTSYADDMDKSRSTVKALIRRLDSAAQTPEQSFESVSEALSALQEQWQARVVAYSTAVDTLINTVNTEGTGGDAAAAAQAARKLAGLRGLFEAECFLADVYLITTESAVPTEQRIAARERALTNVRSTRRSLESHPLIRLCFVNPFSSLPLGALLSTLNKLELNLVQSARA